MPETLAVPTTSRVAQALLPGLRAVRQFWKPFVALQLCGVLVLVAYFNHPGFAEFCGMLARIKAAGGVLLAGAAMAFACGVLPELAKLLTRADQLSITQRAKNVLFNMGVFFIAGMIVDRFYHLLAVLLGDSSQPHVVLSKVLIDMLIFTPLWGVLWVALAYTFRDVRYRPRRLFGQLGAGWYLRRVVPMLPVAWAYWFPMTALMYSLPANLQFVFGVAASGASATLLTAVAAMTAQPPPEVGTRAVVVES